MCMFLSELSGSVLHVIRYHNKAPFAKANKSSVIQRHFSHDCLSRMSVREMSKLYILTYYLHFVYREETFFVHYWCVSEWDWLLTSHSTIFQLCDGTYIDVQAGQIRRSWSYGQVPT